MRTMSRSAETFRIRPYEQTHLFKAYILPYVAAILKNSIKQFSHRIRTAIQSMYYKPREDPVELADQNTLKDVADF